MAMSSSFSSSVSSTGSASASTTPSAPTGPSGATRNKSWHVPGPSTRYHKSEHARPKPTPRNSAQHARNPSSLSSRSYTEASASASPLARLNFARDAPKDYSYTPNPNDTIKPAKTPLTPLRSPHNNFNNLRYQNSPYQNSPFSDYFTDDARSVEHTAPYHPSDPAQKLLLRLNNLGSDILRLGLSTDSLYDFNEKLCSLEAIVQDGAYSDSASLTDDRDRRESFYGAFSIEEQPQGHEARDRAAQSPDQSSKSRLSDVWIANACDYADTFTQTDEEPQPAAPDYSTSSTQTQEEEPQNETAESGVWVSEAPDYAQVSTQTSDDGLVTDLQQVVDRLAKANESLRHRHDETKDHLSVQIEDLTTQLMSVKSENDTLKQDLGFDHSELLFLKLQLQAIEVQTNNLDRNNHVLLAEDLVKWKADWDNVDARLRSRRQKNRVASAAPLEHLESLGDEAAAKTDDQGNWQLETRKHHHGRVRSVTLTRVDEPESQDDEATLVDAQFDLSASPAAKAVYSEQSTQTEEPPAEAQETQTDELRFETQGTQTDAELPIQKAEVVIEQTEPLDESEDEDEEEEEEEELQFSQLHSQSQHPHSPPKEQEHLCRACGGDLDYSSSEDEASDTKTPWRELCDGLVAFAGMQRD